MIAFFFLLYLIYNSCKLNFKVVRHDFKQNEKNSYLLIALHTHTILEFNSYAYVDKALHDLII